MNRTFLGDPPILFLFIYFTIRQSHRISPRWIVMELSRNYKRPQVSTKSCEELVTSRRHLQSNDLSSDVLPPGLLVVHDTSRGGQDNVTELTRRQEPDNPLLKVGDLDGVAGRDASSLVNTAVKLDDDLAGPVVINLLELANVAYSWLSIRKCCVELNVSWSTS